MVALLPWLLIAARAAAALALAVALTTGTLTDRLVFWLFVVAFVSDYFDGVIARALKVVTRRLRQADSLIDTVFYMLLAGATWTLHPEVLRRHAMALGVCVGTLGAWYLLDLVRWRAVAGFHSWSAKLFAGALGVWAIVQYGLGGGGPWLVVACVVGTLSISRESPSAWSCATTPPTCPRSCTRCALERDSARGSACMASERMVQTLPDG